MTGFYELLQVAPDSSIDALRAAYHDQVALVVRRQRAAETRNQDTTPLEARRAALAEAWEILSDPVRRRRYDRFRALSHEGLPTDLDSLWKRADTSMVDPAAAAAIEVVRTLTTLRIESLQPPAPTAEPAVARVMRRPVQEQEQPSVAPVAAPAATEPTRPPERASAPAERPSAPVERVSAPAERPSAPAERPSVPVERASAPAERPSAPPAAPPSAPPATAPGTGAPMRATRALNAPTEPLDLARHVSAEDLARLLDQYGPSGAFLAAVRDLRRVSVARLAETTRISVRYLEAMERDAYADLPNAAFVKGYLRMVVRTLDAIPAGPETEDYVEGFMARFHRARG